MNKQDIKSIVQLTVEWLNYLDIYKIEGCTEEDVIQGMDTGGSAGAALADKMSLLTRKEWQDVISQVIEAVNAVLYEEA